MQNNIQIKFSCLLLAMLLLLSFSACRNRENDKDLEEGSGTQPVVGNKVENPSLFQQQNVATHIAEDGWIYIFFYYHDSADGSEVTVPYIWQVNNMRYSANEEYPDGPAYVQWGKDSIYPEKYDDMRTIAGLLGYGSQPKEKLSVEEMLALTEEDLPLKTIDPNLFLSLMRQALTQSEPNEVGPYISVPESGILIEHRDRKTNGYAFLDGYSFQIGYQTVVGTIAAIHIDVLYEDADQPLGFSQLSDMIDAGEATEEQIELYAELKRIEQGVLENCDFLFENTEYDDKVIAGVDLARLAVTLERVEYGDFAGEGW